MSPRGSRGARRQVMLVSKRGRFLVGEPIFEREGRVALDGGPRVKPGTMALVEFAAGKARVVEPLGSPEKAADVIQALLREQDMGNGFPAAVESEAAEAAAAADRVGGERRDLIDLPTFTIDPARARDFDDAISASKIDGGVRVWIHIADVAAHVRPGGALEAEAYRRANSTYVPGTVEPMLPHALSSDACSLVPGEIRLTVTAEIELSDSGEPRSASFYRSRIRSDARLTYEEIDEVFAGRRKVPEPVAEPIALARRAAAARADRRAGSSLQVSSSEPEFRFDDDGDVVAAEAVEQTESHSLIEQLMVLTNEQVAELEERKHVPTLYRVHEQPDPDRIERLVQQLDALEIPSPPLPKNISPTQAGELAVQASRLAAKEAERRGHGRDAYTSLVLRSMQQAHYSDSNLGHAGLGSAAYAHFTSPIRRYPDLVAHRALLSIVGADEEAPRGETLSEVAAHCSDRERDSSRLERDGDDVCAAFLLRKEMFERGPDARFDGEVSGVVGGGAFVRFGGTLADVYEGFLPARLIGGRERYELDESETMLVGAREGTAIRMGDPVRVGVDSIEAPRGRVDLVPAEGGSKAPPKRAADGKPKPKGQGRPSPKGKGKGKGRPKGKGGRRRNAAPRGRGRR